ncbi:hypothetical protein [Planctomicrobium sp. SH664]|uniref:hypothetical protein n=1 Tax=Planctomicrobium sp. SH664 TaxID=3448125 RepID=UPI003F5BB798
MPTPTPRTEQSPFISNREHTFSNGETSMAAATKTKPSEDLQSLPVASQQHVSVYAIADRADEILRRAALGDGLSPADSGSLIAAGLLRNLDRAKYVEKMVGILEKQQIAGTAEERAAAQAHCDDLKEKAAERLPGLQKQISELQLEVDRLNDGVRAAENKVATMNQAVRELRDPRHLLPILADVRATLQRERRAVSVGSVKLKISEYDKALKSIESGATSVWDRDRERTCDVTPDYVFQLQEAKAAAERELRAMQRAEVAIDADVDELLNRYVP